MEESGERTTVFRLSRARSSRSSTSAGVRHGRRKGAGDVDARAPRHGACAVARARVGLSRASDTLSVVLLAAGPHRHQPGDRRCGIAASIAQPPRPAGVEERFRSILRLLEFTADWKWLEAL